MKKIAVITLIMVGLSGCVGVNIKPISPVEAESAHKDASSERGYIVYEPLVVVEISQKEVCVQKNTDGKCVVQEIQCSAGTPFLLPDYSKPYLVNVKSGFGKAGVDITIADGWRLSNVKDNSDNTAVLGLVEKVLSKVYPLETAPPTTPKCKEPGLYRVNFNDSKVELTSIHIY